MFDEYIDEFIPSPEMREYLKNQHGLEKSRDTVADIIYYAPAALKKKEAALEKLLKELESRKKTLTDKDIRIKEDGEFYLNAIKKADSILKEEGIFSVELRTYDEDFPNSDSRYFKGVFADYDDVTEFIKQNMEFEEIEDDSLWVYEACKWVKNEKGKYIKALTYIIVRGEIWYLKDSRNIDDDKGQILLPEAADMEWCPSFYSTMHLNLAVPFKPGDIVEVNLYPFSEKRIVQILETGELRGMQCDCCSLQGLYRISENEWDYGAIKHCHIDKNFYDECVSPLYTITLYRKELPLGYEIMKKIQNLLKGDEELGYKLWDKLSRVELSDDMLDSIVQQLEKENVVESN